MDWKVDWNWCLRAEVEHDGRTKTSSSNRVRHLTEVEDERDQSSELRKDISHELGWKGCTDALPDNEVITASPYQSMRKFLLRNP